MRKLIAALLIAVILVTVVSMSGFASDCAQIREDILRIHAVSYTHLTLPTNSLV